MKKITHKKDAKQIFPDDAKDVKQIFLDEVVAFLNRRGWQIEDGPKAAKDLQAAIDYGIQKVEENI